KRLFWSNVMCCSTTAFWYGLQFGKVPYSENTPWKPQSFAGVQDGPISAGLNLNRLFSTCTFWVFQRQSPKYGCLAMLEALQDLMVGTDGATRVQVPELELAGELQNLSAFSQRMTPPQLLMKEFFVIRNVPRRFPRTRLSAPDSET